MHHTLCLRLNLAQFRSTERCPGAKSALRGSQRTVPTIKSVLFPCHEICISRFTKYCTYWEIYTWNHQVLRLPQNLHFKVDQACSTCHEICTSTFAKCCTHHEICTTRFTESYSCYEFSISGSIATPISLRGPPSTADAMKSELRGS